MLKLGRVTKVKVLFLALVFVFLILAYSNVFKFSAVILEKGLLRGPKAAIKGVFRRLYCCYGNLLCRKNDKNVLFND